MINTWVVSHNRFFFISRESQEGEIWYYSTSWQFEELLSNLDRTEMEIALYRELTDNKSEILRQMLITESLTNQLKGNKRSYIEIEHGMCNFRK